ncbi:MAG: 4Fe-4S binding protein [Lachnospiraceae bacterium]|nr:4Fe-4S binding protein [Lachnospiraceae bacterium]MDE6699097.1 4Fe-4S binding protein [Lachnospiraceae bacterium]
MAHKISEECVMCGACESACPVSAITAGDGQYVIDEATCIDCGSCAATCPTGAAAAN